jgi:hypothetical protein
MKKIKEFWCNVKKAWKHNMFAIMFYSIMIGAEAMTFVNAFRDGPMTMLGGLFAIVLLIMFAQMLFGLITYGKIWCYKYIPYVLIVEALSLPVAINVATDVYGNDSHMILQEIFNTVMIEIFLGQRYLRLKSFIKGENKWI